MNTKKRNAVRSLFSVGLALALPAALAWYCDVYVNWQPRIYPFAIIALALGITALSLLVSGVLVENNLLVNVPGYGIQLSGRDHTVRGNVVVNAGRHPVTYDDRGRQGALSGGWHTPSREGGSVWQGLFDSPRHSEPWRLAFPRLAALHGDFNNPDDPNFAVNPAGSVVAGNIFVGRSEPRYDESVLRFSEIGPNEEYSAWKGRKYWAPQGITGVERVGRAGAF